MSDDKSLAIRDNNAQISTRYNEADIQQEMSILKAAFPRLDAPPEGLRALIIASKFSGLNPFRGEIYYIPKAGITVASKIKAADAIAWAQAHGNTLNIRFEKLTELHPEWQQVNPGPGDVCWVCIIISSKQRREYFNWRIQVIDELKALGYQRAELEAELNKRCGTSAPETRAVGIVRGAEDFGDKYQKATIFSRDDRAQKRALQKALNIGGFAAPDMRQYGGVVLGPDEPASEATVESPYRVVESGVSGAAEMSSYGDDEPPTGNNKRDDAPALTPVSQADRAAFSKLVDRHNTLAELSKGAATMSDDQKRNFIAALDALIVDVNAALTLRDLPQIERDDKVSVRFKRMTSAVNAVITYDDKAPVVEPQPALV